MAPITAQGTHADAKGGPGTPTTTGTPAKSPGNRSWADYDDDSEVEEPESPNPLISAGAKILMRTTSTTTAPTTTGIYDTIVVQKPPAFARSSLVPRTPTKADPQLPQPTAPKKLREQCPNPAAQNENDGGKHTRAQDDSAQSSSSSRSSSSGVNNDAPASPLHPAIHEDTIVELLTGLKHLAASLPETTGTTKTAMLDIIAHTITKAKAEFNAKETSMENDIRVIKAVVTTQSMPATRAPSANRSNDEESPTYAAIAAKVQQRDALKQQREKTEVTISLRNEDEDSLAAQLCNVNEERRAQLIQEFIVNEITKPATPGKKPGAPVKIAGTFKISKYLLKIICTSEADADAVRSLRWKEMLGATVAKPAYGVVIHGVSKEDMDPRANGFNMQDAADQIEGHNPFKITEKQVIPVKVTRISPLMRKPKNPRAPSQSLVVFTEDRAHADHLILRGVRIGGRIHSAHRYMPQHQLTQCYKCQGYRHRSEICTRQQKCGRCAGNHPTKECREADASRFKCAVCQGNHAAWDNKCPRRIDETKQLEHMRNATPPTFHPST
jgi:hypothetical protein